MEKHIFENPPKEFRGAPFWSWNGKLDRELMKKQMDDLAEMGFGGFHIHSRIGLQEEYLGKSFLDSVEFCCQYAKEKGLLLYLYDEDKWPSGYGGGRVTDEEAYRARYVLLSPYFHEDGPYDRGLAPSNRLTENGTLKFLRSYQIRLEEGKLKEYHVLTRREDPDRKSVAHAAEEYENWYAYLVVTDPLPWFNNQAYVDTLNPRATEKFLKTSYEPYGQILGEEFSRTVPSIFTDEPQFTKVQNLSDGKERQEVGIPFNEIMEEGFRAKYGESLLDVLPEIFWDLSDGKISEVRYRYFDFLAEQFARSYAGVLGEWCGKHGIALTGHVMEEGSLEKQLRSVGEAMRSYAYFQIPGIDMLADAHEYTTAKQVQSVARQMGKKGVSSELYGVTNWDFDFRGHKHQGDWQAALGVTLRVPHLAWMYMGGESKRDYPAPIDGHSTWYQKYPLIEDHFARVIMAMQQGSARVRVGVFHPIESMFMEFGPSFETAKKRKLLEEQFQNLTKWLLFGTVDFDFISEAMLPELYHSSEGGKFRVGQMQYEVLIVPELTTIRSTTLGYLKKFSEQGGTILVMGELPGYLDGHTSEVPGKQLDGYVRIGFERDKLLKELAGWRDVLVTDQNGLSSEEMIYQLRRENEKGWLFLACGKKRKRGKKQYTIRLTGNFRVMEYHTLTGNILEPEYFSDGKYTYIAAELYAQDSLLFELIQSDRIQRHHRETVKEEILKECLLPSETEFTLEEQNVLLLDMAEYALDGGPWQPREEILRIDDIIRTQAGYRKRTDSFPQPWLSREKDQKDHLVSLRFRIRSMLSDCPVDLAFEGDEDVSLMLNGQEVPWKAGKFYVDSAIHRIPLGNLKQGENLLECRMPFGNLTNLEWFYLLGDFGVRVYGSRAELCEQPKKLGFGDYSVQGFPFYGGNMTYETSAVLPEGELRIRLGEYTGALAEVSVDGKAPVTVCFEPYEAELGHIEEGVHQIRITLYGTRINTFGQLHNCNEEEQYFGPKTWRTQGKDWCYEYRLRPCGIRRAPVLQVYKEIS